MLFVLSACTGKNESWAVEVDGEQIPTGIYLYYQFNAYQEAASLAEDAETDLFKQKIEDQDATVWIHQKTIELCRRRVAAEREFARLELTMDEGNQQYIDSIVDYIMSYYKDVYEQNGIGIESVTKAVTTDQMTTALFYKYYGEDGLEMVTDAQMMEYYTGNYAAAYMFGTSVAGYEEADAQTARDAAATAAESIKAGKGVAETAAVMTKAINPDAEIDEEADDSHYMVAIGKDDESYPQAFRDAVFAAAVDTPVVYDQDDYLLVYVRKDAASETETFEGLKDTILQSLKGDEFEEKLDTIANALTVTENTSAVRYYSAKKIKDLKDLAE